LLSFPEGATFCVALFSLACDDALLIAAVANEEFLSLALFLEALSPLVQSTTSMPHLLPALSVPKPEPPYAPLEHRELLYGLPGQSVLPLIVLKLLTQLELLLALLAQPGLEAKGLAPPQLLLQLDGALLDAQGEPSPATVVNVELLLGFTTQPLQTPAPL
jgi:hypothetical protein